MPETISNYFKKQDFYQNAIGVPIVINLNIDLTTNITKVEFRVRKPSIPEYDDFIWEAQVHENTKIKYLTKEGDLDTAGFYYIQPIVYYNDGSIIPYDMERIAVFPSLL